MSKTTTITVPAPVQVEFDKQGAPNETDTIEYTFYRNFLSRIVLIDPSFGKDALSVIAAMEIRGKFKDAKPGDKVVLPLRAVQAPEGHRREAAESVQPVRDGTMHLVPPRGHGSGEYERDRRRTLILEVEDARGDYCD